MKKLIICILLGLGFLTYLNAKNYPNMNRYSAKGLAHFNENNAFLHYSIFTYENNKRVIREDHISESGEPLSHTIFNYDTSGRLISENTFSPDNKTVKSKKNYSYDTYNRKNKAVLRSAENSLSYISYQYGYKSNRLLYEEEIGYSKPDNLAPIPNFVKRTTFNLSGLTSRIDYYEKKGRKKKAKLELKWYEEFRYGYLGQTQYIIRFDSGKYARALIKYQYDKKNRLKYISVYEGYVQFFHSDLDYESQFTFKHKVKLLYKLDPKILAYLNKTENKTEEPKITTTIEPKITTTKKSDVIEVIFVDFPEREEEDTSDIEEIPVTVVDPKDSDKTPVDKTPVDKTPVDKTPVDKTPVKPSEKPKESELKSWCLNINKEFTTRPLYGRDSSLYIGIKDNKLINIDMDGRIVWEKGLDGNIITNFLENEEGDLIYFGTDKGTLIAMSTEDGKTIWKKEKLGSFLANGSLYLTEDEIIIFNTKKELTVFNNKNGELLWKANNDKPMLFAPVSDGENVFIISESHAYGFDITTGTKIWTLKFSDKMKAKPVISDSIVIICGSTKIQGINIEDGKVKWSIDRSIAKMNPYLYKGFVYIGTDEGRLLKIEAETGVIKWDHNISLAEFILSGDDKFLYLSFQSDTFIILDYVSGDEVNRFVGMRDDEIITPILSSNDDSSIYFGTKSWKLYKDTLN